MFYKLKQSLKAAFIKQGWQPPSSLCTGAQVNFSTNLHLLKGLGFRPRTIVDLGAAEGNWSMCAHEAFPECRIFMCEPLPQRKEQLLSIVKQAPEAFSFIPCAVGGEEDPILFNVSADLHGSGVYGSDFGNQISVPQITLDKILKTNDANGLVMIKFGTHGYESKILDGGTNTLKITDLIIMECYLH